MATLGVTQVTSDGIGNPLPIGGGIMIEIWRYQGGTVGDTATITPKHGRRVLAVSSGIASNALVAAGSNTNCVLTLVASAATDVTFDAVLYTVP